MEDYSNLKSLALQKRLLLTTTANEVIAHEEHIGKTKDVFVKLFLGEETTDGGGGSASDAGNDPASQESSDPIVPDPVIPTPIPDPSIEWTGGVEGLYPVATAPVADPEGYVRFADPSNNHIIFLKQESTTPVTYDNMPTDVVLPSVSLINAMANYNIVRTVTYPGAPNASDLWPAEQLVYHWTKECLEAMIANNGVPGANIVNKVWALEWDPNKGLVSRITTDSRPYHGMPYFSLYTGV